jgi:hypothetical protein
LAVPHLRVDEDAMGRPITEATEIPVGFVFEVAYPMFVARTTFLSRSELNFNILEGPYAGTTETVDYQVINLRPGLFVVSWQEQSKATLVQIEDFVEARSTPT